MSKFMYGLLSVKVGEKVVGYIEENSFKFNGEKGEVTEIKAAQVKGASVLAIPKSNGKISPSFDLIDLDYDALALLLGGEVIKTGEDSEQKVTGWKAPSNLINITNKVEIQTDSAHKIVIKKALITAYIDGDLNLDSVAKLKVEVKPLQPDEVGAEPYSIEDVSA